MMGKRSLKTAARAGAAAAVTGVVAERAKQAASSSRAAIAATAASTGRAAKELGKRMSSRFAATVRTAASGEDAVWADRGPSGHQAEPTPTRDDALANRVLRWLKERMSRVTALTWAMTAVLLVACGGDPGDAVSPVPTAAGVSPETQPKTDLGLGADNASGDAVSPVPTAAGVSPETQPKTDLGLGADNASGDAVSPVPTAAGVSPETQPKTDLGLGADNASTELGDSSSPETSGERGVFHIEGDAFYISEVVAPEWPFRGAVTLDRGSSRVDFYDARDGSVTSIDLVGFTRPAFCSWSTMVWDENRVLVEIEGPYSYRDVIEIPWGQSGSLMPDGSMIDWHEVNAQTDHGREGQAGDSSLKVIRQFNGLILQMGDTSAGYYISRKAGMLGTVYTPEGELEGSEAQGWVEEWARRVAISSPQLDYNHAPLSWLLGTDGELVGFAFTLFEPACVRPKLFLASMRTGELLACSEEDLAEIMLVHPRDQDLVVEEVRLPPSGWLNSDKSPCAGSSRIELGSVYETAA